MIVDKTPRIRHSFRTAWHALSALFLWDIAVTIFYFLSPFRAPALPLTLFGTALALFLGFRVNSAYQRWWEARILWGSMINASRSFTRGVLAFLPKREDTRTLRDDLVLRHIAYVQALRCQLRRQDPLSEIRRLLGDRVEPAILDFQNPANGLLHGSSVTIAEAQDNGLIDTIQQTQIERVMVDIANAQGGMERIKNTPLPAQYRSFPSFFTRLFCILLPIGLVETLEIATPFGSAVAGFMYLAVLQIGDDLVDPFANTAHDVPLTAMCRTIEIDLLQIIGRPTPPKLEPENGILW
ncbi:bestrophin family protein [Sphingomonas sp.]|uniref:bestrophin family protein n=1 Tax=Sphingomonas sp. TaxID=28214 RepID=UPI003B3B507B